MGRAHFWFPPHNLNPNLNLNPPRPVLEIKIKIRVKIKVGKHIHKEARIVFDLTNEAAQEQPLSNNPPKGQYENNVKNVEFVFGPGGGAGGNDGMLENAQA